MALLLVAQAAAYRLRLTQSHPSDIDMLESELGHAKLSTFDFMVDRQLNSMVQKASAMGNGKESDELHLSVIELARQAKLEETQLQNIKERHPDWEAEQANEQKSAMDQFMSLKTEQQIKQEKEAQSPAPVQVLP